MHNITCYFDKFEKKVFYYIIWDGENEVGYFEMCYGHSGLASLAELYILEEYRGKGVGNAVIPFILNFCKNLGYNRIELFVSFDNEIAQKLYRKWGFKYENYMSSYCYLMSCDFSG